MLSKLPWLYWLKTAIPACIVKCEWSCCQTSQAIFVEYVKKCTVLKIIINQCKKSAKVLKFKTNYFSLKKLFCWLLIFWTSLWKSANNTKDVSARELLLENCHLEKFLFGTLAIHKLGILERPGTPPFKKRGKVNLWRIMMMMKNKWRPIRFGSE